ncbi:hypothetical protein KEJ15_00825, partial [Candidatus Bathyarchaeota archaeon]|nr:hypothetical protein [Candidatus Bathyarchaeota archaeon]
MRYYYDSVIPSHFLGSSNLTLWLNSSSLIVYESVLTWCPLITGSHSIFCELVTGNPPEIVAVGNEPVEILPCPTNLVVHIPEVVAGDCLNIVVAVAKPRLYTEGSYSEWLSYSLAPKFWSPQGFYVIDDPVKNFFVEFCVNGSCISASQTNDDGLCNFMLPLSYSGSYFVFNLTCHSVEMYGLYQEKVDQRFLVLGRVNVSSSGAGG